MEGRLKYGGWNIVSSFINYDGPVGIWTHPCQLLSTLPLIGYLPLCTHHMAMTHKSWSLASGERAPL